jgi:XTP/dITP diphosphohydrolase
MTTRRIMMNKKLVMATNNANKLREVREILAPLGIDVISQREAGADTQPEENGNSFEENAFIKAKAVYDETGLPVIADDSGICVDALDGRPGIYSARYAPKGEECRKLTDELENVPDSERTAHFECVIVFMDGDCTKAFSGKCEGKIGYEERGTNGFGYDPVFMYGDKSFAEISSEEKNKISHRAKAIDKLYEFLKERYGY